MHPERALPVSVEIRRSKAKLAAATRYHPNAEHAELRRDLAAAKLEAYVAKTVAEAPPLTPSQIRRIAILLSTP